MRVPHLTGAEATALDTRDLPPFLRVLLTTPPPAGGGIHQWLFRVARQLHTHRPAPEIVALLESKVSGCGRHVPRSEIVAAVQSALACAWQPSGTAAPPPVSTWPLTNLEQREAILRDGITLADLWELSPVYFEDASTEAIIDQLFPGNPLLCCGESSRVFDTRPREEWRGELASLALIVPSPMSSPLGVTKDGKESAHTLSNTGDRRFLVVEFDSGTFDEHASLLLFLSQFGPLVLAVHSGSKSLHGWFYCAGQPEEKLKRFMRYAVSLGADRATWTRSQFVRMPDGTRDNGQRQAVFYFNPEQIGAQL